MDLEEACRGAYEAIFAGKSVIEIGGKQCPVLRSSAGKLRYVDVIVNGETFRIMEQNPKKTSEWAEKARQGSKIAWALKGRAFYARIVDGQYTQIVKRKV